MTIAEMAEKLQVRSRWPWVLAVVVLLVGAFATGRYTVQATVVEKEKVVTVEVEKVVTVEKVVEKKIYVYVEKKDTHTETVETKQPDGTVITKTVTDTKTDTTASSVETKVDDKAVTTTSTETKVDDKSKTTTAKAEWRLRVDAGAGARFGTGQLIPILVLGVGAERRIVGPFWMGVWAQTTLNLVAPQTPPYQVAGGLSVGVEF